MKISSLKLKNRKFDNWYSEVEDHWDYPEFLKRPHWRKDWISFDCLCYVEENDTVYVGITSFDNDIFRGYDRKTGKWVSTGYEKIADPYDAKFHRSLVEHDGSVYGAIALLHDVDRFYDAPGGAIVKYDIKTKNISKIGIPLDNVYIQAMDIDKERNIAYCLCFPPEYLVSYNLKTGETRNYGLIGPGHGGMAQGQNILLDDEGCLWCNWALTRAWQNEPGVDAVRLCKVNPQQDKIVFYQKGLPLPDGSHGTAKPESYFNFHDGFIYASGPNGSLYRIDTETAEAKYLFTPISDRPSRLTAMVLAPDGYAYGVTGGQGKCELIRFDFKNDKYELLGDVVDQEGEPCWQVHDVVIASDGTFYAGENDNPLRSSYLWEIKGIV